MTKFDRAPGPRLIVDYRHFAFQNKDIPDFQRKNKKARDNARAFPPS